MARARAHGMEVMVDTKFNFHPDDYFNIQISILLLEVSCELDTIIL